MQLGAVVAAVDEGNVDPTGYPIIPHLGELIVGTIFFVILLWIVTKKVVPRLEKMFAERRAAIEGNVEKAERAQAEAQAALEQYRAQLADARGEANAIREQARQQGAAIIAEMRQQAQAEADRITSAAHAQIEAERQQTMAQLRLEVGRLATDLASRIVGESLQDEVRRRGTVERFLADLEQSPTVTSR